MEHQSNRLTIFHLLKKLDELYEKEEKLKKEYQQLLDDINYLETTIMYASNKKWRENGKSNN